MRIFYILCILFMTGSIHHISAQDLETFKSAFAKSATYYKTQDQYTLSMGYEFYEDEAQETPTETLEGTVIKKKAIITLKSIRQSLYT